MRPCHRIHIRKPNLTRRLHTPSSTALGTAYELAVARRLRRLGLALTRVGRANDCGIDLVGSWSLPSLSSPNPSPRNPGNGDGGNGRKVDVPAFLQCKNLLPTRRSSPAIVREVEGAFPALQRALAVAKAEGLSTHLSHDVVAESRSRAAAAGTDEGAYGPEVPEGDGAVRNAIGLLATTRPATKGVRDALARSRVPLGYVQVVWGGGGRDEGAGNGDGAARVVQLLWNARAASSAVAEGALGRCEVGVRYLAGPKGAGEGEEEMEKEAVLLHRGELWDPFGGGE